MNPPAVQVAQPMGANMVKLYHINNPDELILRDYLARDRTVLALERTLLSYIRTAIGAFSAGIACVKFIFDSPLIYVLGMLLITAAFFFLVRGIIRYFDLRERLRSIPDNSMLPDPNGTSDNNS